MRIDLFLKVTGLFKARSEAKRSLLAGRIELDGKILEPSDEVRVPGELSIRYRDKTVRVRLLEVPSGKSVARAERGKYVNIVDVRED